MGVEPILVRFIRWMLRNLQAEQNQMHSKLFGNCSQALPVRVQECAGLGADAARARQAGCGEWGRLPARYPARLGVDAVWAQSLPRGGVTPNPNFASPVPQQSEVIERMRL